MVRLGFSSLMQYALGGVRQIRQVLTCSHPLLVAFLNSTWRSGHHALKFD